MLPYLPFTPQPHSPLPHGGPNLLSSQPSLPRRGQASAPVPERLQSAAVEVAASHDASALQACNIMDAAYRAPIGLKLTKSPSMVEWFTQQLELQHDGQHNGGPQSQPESQPSQHQQPHAVALFGSWQRPSGPSIPLASLTPGQGGLEYRDLAEQDQDQDATMEDDQALSMTSSMMMEESWDAGSTSTSATSPPSRQFMVASALSSMHLDHARHTPFPGDLAGPASSNPQPYLWQGQQSER